MKTRKPTAIEAAAYAGDNMLAPETEMDARIAIAAAARALRAIPSPVRSEASRANGAKGGRLPSLVHVTRIYTDGSTYGHARRHCDQSGCAGEERYLGVVEGAETDHVYQLDGARIVAEIVE